MKRILLIVIPVGILVALLVWRFTTKAAADKSLATNAPGRQAQNVLLATAGPRKLISSLEAVGTIDTPFDVKLSPNVAGPITYLQVREGDPVKTGDVLVRIDPTELQAAVLQQAAAVAEANQRYVQAKLTQNPNDVNAHSQVEQNQASLNSAKADYGQINANLAAQVAQQQQVVVDNQSKVRAANSMVENTLAGLNSAQASYTNANVKYERYETLYKQGFVAAQDVDDQRTAADVAKAAVNVAQAQVDSARSALKSAAAELDAALNQLKVVKLQGTSTSAASKAKMDQAVSTLKYAQSNLSTIPSYAANLAALKATYDTNVAQLKQAQARLTYTTIKSSIDGVVTQRTADPGNIASPGTPVLTIQYLKWVYLTSTLPVEFSDKVYAGQPVTFSVDAMPGQKFQGKIAQVVPSADPVSRQFEVRVKVDNPKFMLRPGMFARLHVILSTVDADVVVPREAITTGTNGQPSTVITVSPGTTKGQFIAHIVPVQLGVSDTTGFQVLSGVKAGDQVVVQTYQALKDGQKVRTGPPDGGASGPGGKSKKKGTSSYSSDQGAADSTAGGAVTGTGTGGSSATPGGTSGGSAGTTGSSAEPSGTTGATSTPAGTTGTTTTPAGTTGMSTAPAVTTGATSAPAGTSGGAARGSTGGGSAAGGMGK